MGLVQRGNAEALVGWLGHSFVMQHNLTGDSGGKVLWDWESHVYFAFSIGTYQAGHTMI